MFRYCVVAKDLCNLELMESKRILQSLALLQDDTSC
jgi:hypothetical protein